MKAAIFTPASGETYRSSIASATAAMVVAVLSGVARDDGASCAATAVASRVAARRIVLGMPPFVYNWRAAHNGFRRRACKFYVVNIDAQETTAPARPDRLRHAARPDRARPARARRATDRDRAGERARGQPHTRARGDRPPGAGRPRRRAAAQHAHAGCRHAADRCGPP